MTYQPDYPTMPAEVDADRLAAEWRTAPAIDRSHRASAVAADPYSSYGYVPGAPWNFPEPPVSRTIRLGTIVWGFVLVVMGALSIAASAGATPDVSAVSILLLTAAGVSLVGSAIISAFRNTARR
jgi:hypothetical protein